MARGDISRSGGMGKLVDKLPYEVIQVDGCEPVRLEIQVYMSKRFGHSEGSRKPVIGAQFHLRCEDEGIDGTDIDACIAAMRARLDRRYAIRWENWFKVRIEPVRNYGQCEGTGLELKWERVQRGTAMDGTVLMREYVGRDAQIWKIRPWPDYFRDKSGRTLACIPETDANVEALEAFKERIDEMRRALSHFVSPEHIEKTLAAISSGGMKFLSAPNGES